MRSNIDMRLGDCMDYMKDLDDNAFELAICDPPYGIDVTKMNMGSRLTVKPDKSKKWDSGVPCENYFKELFRCSKNQIIWGGNYFNLPPSRCFLIWDKGESMYGRDFAEAELAWTSFDKVVRIFKYNPNQKYRIHATQKPVALYRWLLTTYAQAGDKILDTHGGSGSICLACWDLKFDLTWIEKDKDYYNAAVERFNAHTDQLQMF